MKYWTNDEIEYLKIHYPYETSKSISKVISRSIGCIADKARRLGIKKNEYTRKSINHFYFDEWSENMAYILGFWSADGCAHKDRTKRSIIFTQSDTKILEKIKSEVESGSKISRLQNSLGISYQFRFVSRRIYGRIESIFGCQIQNKSLTIQWPVELPDKYFRDFVRGLIDGDGSVTFCGGKPTISFSCGSRDFIETFRQEVKRMTGIDVGIHHKTGYASLISYGATKAICLAKYLYYNNDILSIERKHLKAKDIIENSEIQTVPKLSPTAKQLFGEFLSSRYSKPHTISGYYGVSPCRKKWKAAVGKEYIGMFDSKTDAAVAYDKRAKEIYGNLARLNFE